MPSYIYSDQNRLRQVLINLISNAIKYTNEGFVRVTAGINLFNGNINFMVEDSGSGIDNEGLSKLFKPFTKIMRDRDRNKDGCGLGLAISRNIAMALNGDIVVSSRLGVGS